MLILEASDDTHMDWLSGEAGFGHRLRLRFVRLSIGYRSSIKPYQSLTLIAGRPKAESPARQDGKVIQVER